MASRAEKRHWPLRDPAGHPGSDAENLARFREARDEIRLKLEEFGRANRLLAHD